MRVQHYYLKLLFMCLITLTGMSHAQETTAKKKKAQTTYRISALTKWKDLEIYAQVSKDKYELLEPNLMSYSKPYRYARNKPIIFYTKSLTNDGKELYTPAYRTSIASSVKEPLLMLHYIPDEKTLIFKVIDFSPAVFPYGSYQVVNLSKTTIYGYFGDSKDAKTCKPDEAFITKPKLKNGEKVPIEFAAKNSADEIKTMFSSVAIHRLRKRTILFLAQAKTKIGREYLTSQTLVDFAPSE